MAVSNYRGYTISRNCDRDGKPFWKISLHNVVVCTQPSAEFARRWVDEQKKQYPAQERLRF